MARPQLLLGFIVLCLCVNAAGSITRYDRHSSLVGVPSRPHVHGAHRESLPEANCAITPCLALTFDDGPHPAVTPRILDILARHQAKATFFVVGKRVASNTVLLQRIHQEGHEIGNHSWDHASFTRIPPADMAQQIQATQQAIIAAGAPAPYLFRPPYGAYNTAVLAHTAMNVIRWNVDPADWSVRDAQKIREHVVAYSRPGAIILLHDTQPSTAEGLALVLQDLGPHYQFVTVSQLLNLAPGDRGLYSGRPEWR